MHTLSKLPGPDGGRESPSVGEEVSRGGHSGALSLLHPHPPLTSHCTLSGNVSVNQFRGPLISTPQSPLELNTDAQSVKVLFLSPIDVSSAIFS